MAWKTTFVQLTISPKQEQRSTLAKYCPVYSQGIRYYGEMVESVLPQEARYVQVDLQREPQIPI